jgi:hypothetical protein
MLVLGSIYYFLLEVPLLQPEMIWLLIGERMSQGYHMYTDIVDDTGPLAAGIYWMLNEFWGRNILIFKILSGLIAFFQIIYLNTLFIRYKSFEDNTYIPALVLCILFFLSFDLLILSPALLGSVFVVLALGQLFSQTVLQKEGSDSVLLMGIFGGLAACFHFPYITFFPFLIFTGIAISGISFNQFLLATLGYLLPLVFCGLYFFWNDGLQDFIIEYIFASRLISAYSHVGFREMLLVFTTPFVLAGLGFFVGNVFRTLTVNQQKQSQIMLIYLGFATLSFFLSNRRTNYQWIVLFPALTYYISHLFVTIRKGYTLQVLSIALIVLIPLIGFGWTFYIMNTGTIANYSVEVEAKHLKIQNKKIVVLGEDLGYYHSSVLATPFLNYRLSKRMIENTSDLVKIKETYWKFLEEKPEIIIDEEGVFGALSEKIPSLKNKYNKISANTYELIEE